MGIRTGSEDWLTLGKVLLHKNVKEAQENPFVFDSAYPFDEMRLRMIYSTMPQATRIKIQ